MVENKTLVKVIHGKTSMVSVSVLHATWHGTPNHQQLHNPRVMCMKLSHTTHVKKRKQQTKEWPQTYFGLMTFTRPQFMSEKVNHIPSSFHHYTNKFLYSPGDKKQARNHPLAQYKLQIHPSMWYCDHTK